MVAANPNVKIKLAQPQVGEDVWDACRREIATFTRKLASLLDQCRLLLVVGSPERRPLLRVLHDPGRAWRC